MVSEQDLNKPSNLDAPSMLGPIHVFGSACFFVFGVIYLVFIHSSYMFFSNVVFGMLGAANWFLVPKRLPDSVRASSFLAIVYIGLLNVAVHLGTGVLPMVFWGMSVTIAAAFLFGRVGVAVWSVLTLLFYPLVYALKTGPLAGRAIALDPSQFGLLAAATYAGLLSFLAYSFVVFRTRLGIALEVLRGHAVALGKSEAFLAESQAVARVGSYDFSIATGTWTSSAVMDEIMGIDAAYRRDVAGWLALVHPDDRGFWQRYFDHDVLAGSAVLDGSYRLARHDEGQEVWVHGRGRLHRDANGVPVRIVGTIHDISGFRRAERERRLLEARLFQAQKLESLGVLAGGVAHDFNNLLTVVLGNVGLALMHEAAEHEELGTPLRHVETAAMRAAELTRQMLAFAGKGRFSVQVLDLNAAVTEMAELLRSSVSKKIELRFALAPTPPRIVADPSQIRQIIMNLILNAAEAIGDEPGVVTLRTDLRETRAETVAPAVPVPGVPAVYRACIETVDTGCGIDAATQMRIFDPFFTTKFTGRGLGLAAVLGIVKRHSGTIAVRSAPGRGATFTLLFPCAPEGTPAEPGVAQAVTDSSSGGTVLVVDDDPSVRGLARAVLLGAGWRVLESADGAECLAQVREPGAEIDLVLLDLTMPNMDGVEAFGLLRRLRPTLPVVLMSGYARDDVLKLFEGAPPNDFLDKPFQHTQLLAIVRKALRDGRARDDVEARQSQA